MNSVSTVTKRSSRRRVHSAARASVSVIRAGGDSPAVAALEPVDRVLAYNAD